MKYYLTTTTERLQFDSYEEAITYAERNRLQGFKIEREDLLSQKLKDK